MKNKLALGLAGLLATSSMHGCTHLPKGMTKIEDSSYYKNIIQEIFTEEAFNLIKDTSLYTYNKEYNSHFGGFNSILVSDFLGFETSRENIIAFSDNCNKQTEVILHEYIHNADNLINFDSFNKLYTKTEKACENDIPSELNKIDKYIKVYNKFLKKGNYTKKEFNKLEKDLKKINVNFYCREIINTENYLFQHEKDYPSEHIKTKERIAHIGYNMIIGLTVPSEMHNEFKNVLKVSQNYFKKQNKKKHK